MRQIAPRPGIRKALVVLPLIVAAAIALSGCSAAGDSPSPAADKQTAGGTAGGGTGTASKQDYADWMLSYAKCMRAQGIDMPDPTTTDGGMTALTLTAGGDSNAYATANTTCEKKLGRPPVQGLPKLPSAKEQQKTQLKMAKCLREHGVDVADPKPGKGLDIGSASQDALSECASATGGMVMLNAVPGAPVSGE